MSGSGSEDVESDVIEDGDVIGEGGARTLGENHAGVGVETARLFLAVPVPRGVGARLCEETRRRLAGVPGWRLVPTRNVHLTLRFLGDVPPDRARLLVDRLAGATAGVPRHILELSAFGVFPEARRPRVFWAGPSGEAERTCALAEAADRFLERLGMAPRDRAFRPHVTLARARRGGTARGPREIEGGFAARVPVDGVVLFRSRLGQGPPRYEPLATAALDGPERAG